MAYFVTGATGFIGRHLLPALSARGAPVYILVREAAGPRLERALAGCGPHRDRIHPVVGDLTQSGLALSPADTLKLRGQVQHLFHLGALYDLAAETGALERANVLGTQNALEFAHSVDCGCFHLVSSIAVAGRYHGRFDEEMFSEARGLDHAYFRTKHESEALVRASSPMPWRIYRPGMVVGHSQSGVIDKIDGPYYFFKLIQQLRDWLPRHLSLPGFLGGYINLVPVDFVAAALDHLAHLPGLEGRCFHLTGEDRRIGEALNIFAEAAHAPTMNLQPAASWGHLLNTALPKLAAAWSPARAVLEQLLVDCDIPRSAVSLLDYPTRFDSTEAQRLLAPAAIRPPPLESYAWRLWDYWERQLDQPAATPGRLRQRVGGKKVLVTGGSSGIGRATAIKLAAAGAQVLVVARDPDKLAQISAEIEAQGGAVHTYSCDLADAGACSQFLRELLSEHGHVDILINNAGRSIRRAVDQAYERLHDYDRLMRINYSAAVHVTLGLLPGMAARGEGHVVNISSIGVLSNAPRFSAYNASKAALEAFSRSAAAEFKERGVHFTVINMPLVRTPMVAPTRLYAELKLLTPEQAADIVCDALVRRPARLTTGMGLLSLAVELAAPALARAIMSQSYRLFPDSTGASCQSSTEPRARAEAHTLSAATLASRSDQIAAAVDAPTPIRAFEEASSQATIEALSTLAEPALIASAEMRALAALLHGVHI